MTRSRLTCDSREEIEATWSALVLGVVSGAIILGRYDLTDEVLLPGLASTRAAGI